LTQNERDEFGYLLRDLYFRLEEREQWIDRATKFLLYTNGSGVGIAIGLLGLFANQHLRVAPVLTPLALFAVGVTIVGAGIYFMAANVRVGRRSLRLLMEKVLAGTSTYKAAFVAIGKFPSKWKYFVFGYWTSFAAFLFGLIATAHVLIVAPWPTAPMPGQ